MRVPDLSVVLPCYNERVSLAIAVAEYCRVLPAAGIHNFELIVVDDASTDGTGALAEALARSEPRLRLLRHERNEGQVASILDGFRAARGLVLTHNGIDLPFHPRDVARMLASIQDGADVVVVERAHRKVYSPLRKVLSWGNICLLKTLLGSPFTDHNFVQFYRAEVVETVPVRSRGVSTVTPELIVRALRAGFRVESCRAEYHERQEGRSTINPRKVAHALGETFRLWQLMRPVAAARAAAPESAPHTQPRRRASQNSEVSR